MIKIVSEYTIAGVSTLGGKTKLRVGNGCIKAKISLMKGNGNTNIKLIQLPKAMTKEQARRYLAKLEDFAGLMPEPKAPVVSDGAPKRGRGRPRKVKTDAPVVAQNLSPSIRAKASATLQRLKATSAESTLAFQPKTERQIKAANLETMRAVTRKLNLLRWA